MDLESLKAKRDARMTAKREQIKLSKGNADEGSAANPEAASTEKK